MRTNTNDAALDYEDRITVLDNGITIATRALDPRIYQPNRSIYAATTLAGARHEGDRCYGIAHFFEHILFGKEKENTWREFFRNSGYQGTVPNASTFSDFTVCAVDGLSGTTLSKKDLPEALALQLRHLREPDFSQETFALEQARITLEASATLDNHARQNYLRFRRQVHPGFLPNDTISTAEDVAAITRKDLKDFYDRAYVGSNIVVPVCFPKSLPGTRDAVTHESIVDLVQREMADLPKGQAMARLPDPPFLPAEQRVAAINKTTDSDVDIELYMPAERIFTKRGYAQDAMLELLWDSLTQETYSNALVYSQSKYLKDDSPDRFMVLGFTTNKTKARGLLETVADVFGDYAVEDKSTGLDQRKLALSKQREIEIKNNNYAFWTLHAGMVMTGKPVLQEDYHDQVQGLAPRDIQQAARDCVHGPIAMRVSGDVEGRYVPSLDWFTARIRDGAPGPERSLDQILAVQKPVMDNRMGI